MINWLHDGSIHLLEFLVDDLGLFVPLEPHHVFGVEAPALLFQGFGSQILCFRSLHIVEYEKQRFGGQTLEELHRFGVWQL